MAQRRVRLCQPSPQLTEHELQGDHSSVFASRRTDGSQDESAPPPRVSVLVEQWFNASPISPVWVATTP